MAVSLFILIIGLCLGSFINVIIYRYPKLLFYHWQLECQEYLKLEVSASKPGFNLLFTPSHCPQCQAKIKPWYNIPLISFIALEGRCCDCQAKLSWRYPLVESLAGLAALILLSKFGLTWALIPYGLMAGLLLAVTFIDAEHQIIPDSLSIGLLWLGLITAMNHFSLPLESAVIGAIVGYLSLWSFAGLFKLITGKEGMGHGDFKLLAALGAWTGWQPLLLVIMIASVLGSTIGILQIKLNQLQRETPMPFGPFLALAGFIAILYGREMIDWYLT